MEGYSYPYASPFPPISDGTYPDHGDGFGDYYEMGPEPSKSSKRQSRSKHKSKRDARRSRSRSKTSLSDRSQSRSKSRSRTISRSRSRSRSHSRPRSHRELNMKTPSFLDDFRVMYLRPSKHKKSTTKYLATKKRQDKVQEILKSDGLGSKRWLFYPRSSARDGHGKVTITDEVPGPRDNIDQRVKVDGHFLRKYKKSKRVDRDAPIAKLKRWELIFYKKLGFIHAV
ncbi:serine/arginine-rich splicing factor 4-like [Colias croceus]|uniref:serine/arginine-rich splicing factor 4-like n=1 Tax=Colias crocea TaxID=72248 RepID=UPI001E27C9A6|nr:serine/arginine-rich splicing factor 4-like [Colias croceus]